MASVLDAVRVLDLSWGVAGPVTGMLLGDHGADVIKIEPPGGDPFRGTPGYDVWLRGRRSVELDLHLAADRETFSALVRSADILLESFGPGVAAGIGADADSLLAVNPRLIVCSISAYGRHEGLRERPGYEALVAARVGLQHEQRGHMGGPVPFMNGDEPFLPELDIPEDMPPGAPRPGPIFSYTPWLSMCAAYLATTGINAALLAREQTGRGQHVETSLLQAALSLTAPHWQRAEHSDATGYRTWIYDSRAPKGFFLCSDGRWIENWGPHPQFALSCADGDTLEFRHDSTRARGRPTRIPPDPENIVVLAHYHDGMKAAFAGFPSDEWVAVAQQAGIPLQPVRTPEEALLDPALAVEDAVVDVPHPELGLLRQVGILYGLSRTPGRVQRGVPLIGENNDEIRAEADAGDLVRPTPPPAPTCTESSQAAARRHRRPRSRFRRGWPVRHPIDGRPRRNRYQGQQLARPVVACKPHRLRSQPRQAEHRH